MLLVLNIHDPDDFKENTSNYMFQEVED